MDKERMSREEAFRILVGCEIFSDLYDKKALRKALDMAMEALLDETPGDNEFLIVEKDRAERYSKDTHLPTAVPKHLYLKPLHFEIDAAVKSWRDTEKEPPTESDGHEKGSIIEGLVTCIDIYGEINIYPWHVVAENWRKYPRWCPKSK